MRMANGWTLLEELSENVTPGGIELPATMEKAPMGMRRARVAWTSERRLSDGKEIPCFAKKGDIVYFPAHKGVEVCVDGKEYRAVHDSSLVCAEEA